MNKMTTYKCKLLNETNGILVESGETTNERFI